MAAPSDSAWKGIKQAGELWSSTYAGQADGDKMGALAVEGLQDRAQAAAAWDLFQAWALESRGEGLEGAHFNLGRERYTELLPALRGKYKLFFLLMCLNRSFCILLAARRGGG
jgi:hypothetical protein